MMENKFGISKNQVLSQKEIEQIIDLPSDSADDLYDSDSDIDPDYSPIQKNEKFNRSLSDDDEQTIGEPTATTETDSEDAVSNKENFNHVTKAVKNKKSVKRDMRWRANKDNDFSKEPPVFEPEKDSDFIAETPLDYFYQLIPESYLEEMCFQGNLYAMQRGKESVNISIGEMKVFLGINFVMTYVKYARLRQYWSTIGDLRLGVIANYMSLNRFETIKRYLHFQDNTKIPSDNKDRLIRLRPFLDSSKKRFMKQGNLKNLNQLMK
ncbi:hypothetical protein AVEN_163742-1 [Araneus ventricosus]|uniref:PiggyBac transposable element-derived protein domain-containing protein n=1 Tax=Araneus ventricosus TaxID=182803 RepID=A0A4Y2N144_ARAVE|nr:hypothetical protein AVEN_163742-1 [Araneus ventricosus]